jgi:hypothetical protein
MNLKIGAPRRWFHQDGDRIHFTPLSVCDEDLVEVDVVFNNISINSRFPLDFVLANSVELTKLELYLRGLDEV